MAEQTVNLPATPERVKSSSSSNGGKGVPHYLRASTGSCHDHCKYGTEHNFLTKPKRPVRKKVVPAALDDDDYTDIVVLVDKKKKSVLEEPKPSSYPGTLISESTKIVKREKKATDKLRPSSSGSKTILPESTKVIRREKKGTAKVLPSPDPKTLSDESTEVIKCEKKVTAAKAMPSAYSKILLSESTEVIKREKKATPKATSSSEPTKVIEPKIPSPSISLGDSSKRVASKPLEKNLSAKVQSSSSPKPIRVKLISSPSSSSLKGNSIAANNGKALDVLVTRAAYLPKPGTVASSSSSSGGRVSEVKTSIPKIRTKKMLASPKASLSPKTSVSRIPSLNARKTKSLKIVSPAENQNKLKRSESKQQSISESMPEKTLHVIKMEPLNKTSIPTDTKSVLVIASDHHDEDKTRASDTLQSAEKGTLVISSSPPSPISPSLLHPIKSVIEKSGADIQTQETDKNEVPLAESPPSSSSLLPKSPLSSPPSLLPGSPLLSSPPSLLPESPPLSSLPSLSLSVESVTEKSCAEKETMETDKNEKVVVEPPHSSLLLLSPGSSSGSVSQSLSSHDDEEEEEEDLDGSEYTDSEAEEEHDKETNNNSRNGKAKMVLSEVKKGNPNPVKLSFRRGKIVDLQQSQGNSTRKLRFRRGRVLGDNQNGDAQKRSYKRREETEPQRDGTNLGSEKVVLKHQDVQGKKDLQGLLNNVIEQTVSRLTGTRRSKVEALVGAFETVISLQDKKKIAFSASRGLM